ncbi:uncharacterized protein LOC117605612 [Osmia lignaria lignaria]|uniref:uncharacterized protein LOC117605612 n=1 Tax=Osmia lignaria lignaria TaxID=1437193 RepID=UPI00147809B3|nr:uncharacterized protein LOC117605612 [Osmia lignaria]
MKRVAARLHTSFHTLYCMLTFSVGVYAGIYISQNYEVPRVDEPAKIIERIKKFADEYKKK